MSSELAKETVRVTKHDEMTSNGSSASIRNRLVSVACYLADQFICGLLVGPLTVFAWWGTWSYLDAHLFLDRTDISGLVCFAIGNCGLMILAFVQGLLKRRLPVDNFWCWLFGYHLYTGVCFFFNVCHWRGMWKLLDYYTGINPLSAWTTYGIGQSFLWMFRASKNAQAPPMVVVYDRHVDFFAYSTRFKVQPMFGDLYVMDVAFTVVVIHQLVVFFWRGAWELMDLYLFPDDEALSAFFSLAIAFSLMALTCVVQLSCNYLYNRFFVKGSHAKLWAWMLELISYFFSNLVNVALWRGVWLTCDRYFIPQDPDVSHGVFIAIGLGVLMIMLCGHSAAIRGCDLDGETSDSANVCMSPNSYLRTFRHSKMRNYATTTTPTADKINDALDAVD